jgi:hypothetical protein
MQKHPGSDRLATLLLPVYGKRSQQSTQKLAYQERIPTKFVILSGGRSPQSKDLRFVQSRAEGASNSGCPILRAVL